MGRPYGLRLENGWMLIMGLKGPVCVKVKLTDLEC